MFVVGQSLFVFATFFVANVHGDNNEIVSLDDVVGSKYVNSEVVKAVKMDMMARGNGYGKDWIVMPNGNGDPEIAILSINWGNKSKSGLDRTIFDINTPPEDVVTFRLFTRSGYNEGYIFDASNLDSLIFDASKPTKVIIHGWRSSDDSLTVRSIRNAYLDVSDVNVITVDWSQPAGNIFYPAPAAYTKQVGQYVGSMVDDLVRRKGARYENFHLIGHSLGAHTVGVAGYSARGNIGRITGLDPALPGFQDLASKENSLDESDAEFVDIIHTCAGELGMSTPIGHADFYPNGGSPFQPGCCCITELVGLCSHGRSHEFFAESIYSNTAFEGIRCDSWAEFKHDSCDDLTVPMGEYTPVTTRGIFYLETSSESPFGLGFEGTKYSNSK